MKLITAFFLSLVFSSTAVAQPLTPFLGAMGKYDVKKERERLRIVGSPQGGYHCLPVFRPGNGPFAYRDGSIIVGKYRASGLLIHSQDSYTALFKRILWFHNKKESITLTIKDRKKNVYEIL